LESPPCNRVNHTYPCTSRTRIIIIIFIIIILCRLVSDNVMCRHTPSLVSPSRNGVVIDCITILNATKILLLYISYIESASCVSESDDLRLQGFIPEDKRITARGQKNMCIYKRNSSLSPRLRLKTCIYIYLY